MKIHSLQNALSKLYVSKHWDTLNAIYKTQIKITLYKIGKTLEIGITAFVVSINSNETEVLTN